MGLELGNGAAITVRPYEDRDFERIQRLNEAEGWNGLVERYSDTRAAWEHLNIAFVTEQDGRINGCIRGMTDGYITLYICELLIDEAHRGWGIGSALLQHVHRLYPKTRIELLASSTSRTFYEAQGYRPFYGFRKTIDE
ncbi:GNAT family N-acetyltransferase [Planococcus lenghuensis]|uniref:GNAT family N-acetyltransferase n=1 Tax=Planococcus lenghuensis TaxID=2213202 RepID=A0A1Q2KWT2_9BACL|nr:GNAT family N-acetyltransferase [Planococcus lenghuensis]AQQ52586.1 GNAT family N-acetyltransferase [Planococcus lenghuensis]